jgi:uncharacterized glyoxalase superfamily metalloenzyme YdcJ
MFLHNLLNVLVQIANKTGLQKEALLTTPKHDAESVIAMHQKERFGYHNVMSFAWAYAVASQLRHYAASRNAAGVIPDDVTAFLTALNNAAAAWGRQPLTN